MLVKLIRVLVFTLAIYGSSTPGLASEAGNKIYLKNAGSEFVIGDPANSPNNYSLQLLVEGPNPGSINVEFADVYAIGESREYLPAGSTRHSLLNCLYLVTKDLNYEPNGKIQTFDLVFEPKTDLDPILYFGQLRISFSPLGAESSGAEGVTGFVKHLIVTQYGVELEGFSQSLFPPVVKDFSVKPIARFSLIDQLFPDLPSVVNFGPIEAQAQYQNAGELPINVSPVWTIRNQQEEIALKRIRSKLMLGGATGSSAIRSVYEEPLTGRELNVLPSFGFVDLEISINSELGGNELTQVVQTRRILIIQWKEPLAVMLLIVLIWSMAKRYRKQRFARKYESGEQLQ